MIWANKCEVIVNVQRFAVTGILTAFSGAGETIGFNKNLLSLLFTSRVSHIVNTPVTAVYCSTLPSFGFGPLSDKSNIVELKDKLPCRPCGLHGRKACPLKHFDCAMKITDEQMLAVI
jgi:ADP-heptose:LPS heptosyltransferase